MAINDVIKDVQHRMHSSIEALHHHFNTLRTGRANAAYRITAPWTACSWASSIWPACCGCYAAPNGPW